LNIQQQQNVQYLSVAQETVSPKMKQKKNTCRGSCEKVKFLEVAPVYCAFCLIYHPLLSGHVTFSIRITKARLFCACTVAIVQLLVFWFSAFLFISSFILFLSFPFAILLFLCCGSH